MIRPLAAIAVMVFALGAATKPAPDAWHKPVAKLADVRAEIESGNRQRIRAYAASSRPKYDADFPKPLDVRVSGPPPREGNRVVVFSCVTPRCAFLSADQQDEGKHVDRVGALYKVKVVKGHAVLHVTLEGDSPARDYIVKAQPSVHPGERATATLFTLTMY
ncbi:MAG TPA: hypothetical protein VN224_15775 [Xanthomonadales bacterium]|nr:hypothetical protein [Xanthomonadales bacterium]